MNELTAALSKIIPTTVKEGLKSAVVRTAFVAMEHSPRFSGQLRASTKIGFNTADLDVIMAPVYAFDALPNAEIMAMEGFKKIIDDYNIGDTIFISNNQEYAWNQEREAGHHMFAMAAHGFQSALDSAINAAK